MKLRKEYVEKLPPGLVWDPYEFVKKNIHYLNPNCKDILLEDLVRIDLPQIYPYILIGLFNEGLLDIKWKQDIERMRWFLERRSEIKRLSPDEYLKWKIFTNSLYGKIRSPLVVEYLHTDLINNFGDEIVYIDVDMIILN